MLPLEDFEFVGSMLSRPECVLATSDGVLHIADWRGGVSIIAPDGSQKLIRADGDYPPKPNGIAIWPDGGWLLAHLGDNEGGVYHLSPAGKLTPFLLEVEGVPLPPTNYVHIDDLNRIWITISTRRSPRSLGYRPDCSDGFIVLVDRAGARIVADGLGYTNECQIHPVDRHLYVNETFSRKLSRFTVNDDGTLGPKIVVSEFGHGVYPDGLTFDANGGIWITSIISNRVIRVNQSGEQNILAEDFDTARLNALEEKYLDGKLITEDLGNPLGAKLRNISSAAFGGTDMKTVFFGCLLGTSIAKVHSPWPGLKPFYWHWSPIKTSNKIKQFL